MSLEIALSLCGKVSTFICNVLPHNVPIYQVHVMGLVVYSRRIIEAKLNTRSMRQVWLYRYFAGYHRYPPDHSIETVRQKKQQKISALYGMQLPFLLITFKLFRILE